MEQGESKSTGIAGLLGQFKPLRLIRAWKKCAGPVLCKQSRFLGVHPHPKRPQSLQLLLEVADPIWRQEFQYQSADILERYRGALLAEGFTEAELPEFISIRAQLSVPTSPVHK